MKLTENQTTIVLILLGIVSFLLGMLIGSI